MSATKATEDALADLLQGALDWIGSAAPAIAPPAAFTAPPTLAMALALLAGCARPTPLQVTEHNGWYRCWQA